MTTAPADPNAIPRYVTGLLVGLVSYTLCGWFLLTGAQPTLKKCVLAYAITQIHGLGITVGYHRLLAHRSFKCPAWVEHTLCAVALCAGQHCPIMWVSRHRRHHQHADTDADSHSPTAGWFWSHMGVWISWNEEAFTADASMVPELVQRPAYRAMDVLQMDCLVMVLRSLACYRLGGTDALLWYALVPYVVTQQLTFCINSIAHTAAWMAYKTYASSDNAHNVWYLGYFVVGEGWHNNHHAFPRGASFGLEWWEFDLGTCLIQLLEAAGLAWDVVRVPRPARDRRRLLQAPAAGQARTC